MLYVDLVIADRLAPLARTSGPEDEIIERYRSYVAPYAGRVRILVSLFFAIVMGSGVSGQALSFAGGSHQDWSLVYWVWAAASGLAGLVAAG